MLNSSLANIEAVVSQRRKHRQCVYRLSRSPPHPGFFCGYFKYICFLSKMSMYIYVDSTGIGITEFISFKL